MKKKETNSFSIGSTIRMLRCNAGIKQFELASHVGITQTAVSLIESERKRPSLTTLNKIATALNTTPERIISLAISSKDKSDVISFIFTYFKR